MDNFLVVWNNVFLSEDRKQVSEEHSGIVVGFDGSNAIIVEDGEFLSIPIYKLTFKRWCK